MGGHRRIDDDHEDQHPIGQQLYAPRYPVYNFNEEGRLQTTNGDEQRTTSHPEKILEKMELI